MISTTPPSFIVFIIAGVTAMPHLGNPHLRTPRSAAFSSGSFANSGASSSAFSSSSTSVIPGPGGSGSFNAKADMGLAHQPVPNYIRNNGNYAENFGYGKDYSNYVIPNSGFGGGGQGGFGGGGQGGFGSPGFNSGFSNPAGYGSGFGGFGGGVWSSVGGAGSYAGPSGSFASSGGFPPNFGYNGVHAPFMPFDFASFMQQYFANAAAHEEFIRKQAQAHGIDVSSNDVGGVGANAYGQIGPQGGFGAASVHPAPTDGLNERFGGGDRTGSSPNSGPVSSVSGTFPPPKGNFHGISTFSSSSQSDINGKKTSQKVSSVSVNDNGKVTTYTAHDP